MQTLTVKLVGPRGFCTRVVRAIDIVERALEKYGAPIYVRHEIVHNKFVVESLKDKGAIFVSELDEVPDDARVFFQRMGCPNQFQNAQKAETFLISMQLAPGIKGASGAGNAHEKGHHIILIGHTGHPSDWDHGPAPKGTVTLVETPDEVQALQANNPILYTNNPVPDDTAETITALRELSRY